MLKTLASQGFRTIHCIKVRPWCSFSKFNQISQISCSNLATEHKYDQKNKDGRNSSDIGRIFIAASLWSILMNKDEVEETPEDKLIMNIKRGILSIQRGEYRKAEKMLHIALKMAQELQHHEGITYIYDILANLALEAGDFDKAEKLFVEVMQRLFGEGYKEDSTKMLHLSAKMAHLCHFQGKLDKALQGFTWTVQKLEEKVKKFQDDEDLFELLGLVKNWYGHLLMDKKLFEEAKRMFIEAYAVYTKIHGEKTEEGIMILNSLSVACTEMQDLPTAMEYTRKAIKLAEEIPKMTEIGVFYANLGLLYMKQGLMNEASEACKFGRRLGLKLHSKDSVEQADYCIEQLKKIKIG